MHIPIAFFDDQGRPDPAGLNFRGVMPIENGGDSGVIDACWLRWAGMWGSTWGAGTFRAAVLTADAAGIGDTGWTSLNAGRDRDYWAIPDAHPDGRPARVLYVEGKREHAAVVVTAYVLPRGK